MANDDDLVLTVAHRAPSLRRSHGRLVIDLATERTDVAIPHAPGIGDRRVGCEPAGLGKLVGHVHDGRLWRQLAWAPDGRLQPLAPADAATAFSDPFGPLPFGPDTTVPGPVMARHDGATHPRGRRDEPVLDLSEAARAAVRARFDGGVVHDGRTVYASLGIPCIEAMGKGHLRLGTPEGCGFRADRPDVVEEFRDRLPAAPYGRLLGRSIAEAADWMAGHGLVPDDSDLGGFVRTAPSRLLSLHPRGWRLDDPEREGLIVLAVRASVDAIPAHEWFDVAVHLHDVARYLPRDRHEASLLLYYMRRVAIPRLDGLRAVPDPDLDALDALTP